MDTRILDLFRAIKLCICATKHAHDLKSCDKDKTPIIDLMSLSEIVFTKRISKPVTLLSVAVESGFANSNRHATQIIRAGAIKRLVGDEFKEFSEWEVIKDERHVMLPIFFHVLKKKGQLIVIRPEEKNVS